ncbi:putative DNA repair helicase rad5,16 [Aspergillus terreus]|uniref:Putative DNA repair helicase rad5,16 n=1 Tax=Aspergillus terreus TaxID=33178 RepID=A0A5M3ZCD1_ASPTE|nr:hypothetical protein ATETN484_0013043000 [Aspergillus terreus]GFF20660.1 putative DNA repair helicase rad5,16 [Aspergillus terreus]
MSSSDASFDVTEISSWKGVCNALETVSSVSELKAWARTHLFCPYFLQLYFDSVLPAQLQGDTSRGESFSTIVLRIHAATNSGDTRYVNPFADRSKWDKADYLARCLTGLVAANTQNIKGLFYRKNVPLERKEKIITHAKNKKLAPADPVDAATRTPSPGRSMSATASEAETPSKPPKQPPPRNWRDELIPATKRTLQPVETLLAQETDPAEAATDKLPAKDELPDEADEKALTPFKLLIATAQTYSIYQPTGQEIDTLTLAHYTAETIADAHAEALDGRLTLTQPTAESIAIAQEHQSWLDNLDLQRENHDEACKALGIQNPDIPKLSAMRINTALRFWQPVAIYALAQFRENPLLSGCILADMVGLGKTWIVTAYIMHRATKLKGQPTLIVCPPHLVWQWAAEIQAVTNRLQVIVYFSDARDQPPVNVKVISKLSKDVSWMTGKKAHHAVVITSYQTLAQRHGPAEYKAWAEDQPNATLEQWPKYLGGLFNTMIADEAHCLRNPNTAQWTAAQWLRPK